MEFRINQYEDFLTALEQAGFTMAGGNADGIYALIPWNWNEEPPYPTKVAWHTGDADTDPWQWRIRVLEEDRGIAYGKFFFKKSGFITRDWYPCFLAARRAGRSFAQTYADGKLSHEAKDLYEIIDRQGPIALHRLKTEAGVRKENQAAFERTLVELQMGLFVTIGGTEQKISQEGSPFGWSSTVFSTTEAFWGPEVFAVAGGISREDALERIRTQILTLNPQAKEAKIKKFILG